MRYHHIPVMVEEVIRYLNCSPGKTIVDGTLGGGGHARAILETVGPKGFLIGIDADPDAVAWGDRSLRAFSSNFKLHQGNFAALADVVQRSDRRGVDGIVLDLGLSLHQLEQGGRGFSFMRDEPLDMRMNPQSDGPSAESLVNRLPERDLADLIYRFGEERRSRAIAGRIVRARKRRRITTSRELADIVTAAMPGKLRPRRIHPATRTFQALRIAVNRELENLETALDRAVEVLHPGGRLCVLSFHSLEDRIVKQRFRAFARACQCPRESPVCTCRGVPRVRILTKKPVRPRRAEVERNPMARSAKLRAVEKLETDHHESTETFE